MYLNRLYCKNKNVTTCLQVLQNEIDATSCNCLMIAYLLIKTGLEEFIPCIGKNSLQYFNDFLLIFLKFIIFGSPKRRKIGKQANCEKECIASFHFDSLLIIALLKSLIKKDTLGKFQLQFLN